MSVNIIQADSYALLDKVVPLFNAYRQFYRQLTDQDTAKSFLYDLFESKASVMLLAVNHWQEALGFAQLYPLFSSVAMQKIWVLNDLFVSSLHRQGGIAKQLVQSAQLFAKKDGADRIILKTEKSNIVARELYQKIGYQQDEVFDHYVLCLLKRDEGLI